MTGAPPPPPDNPDATGPGLPRSFIVFAACLLLVLWLHLLAALFGALLGYALHRFCAGDLPGDRSLRQKQARLAIIALINATLTALYLLVLLPMLGYHVPLGVTLVVLTFFLGLLPIVGNLISNTAVVVAALTVSVWVAAGSLLFLMLVHKLEYFLNAHFVGNRIRLPTFALLATMLVLEAGFGAAGLIAAPVYCAWATRELRMRDA